MDISAKSVLFFICIITLVNCASKDSTPNYLVTTKASIKKGKIVEVLELFKATNAELVKDQSDWMKAVFSKNEETNTVMVQAYWKNKESYLKFSQSQSFQNTMKAFGEYFNGRPHVEINEILFEM